ncbi:MAG: NADH-ubiquinone oxidoreductase-F iron-sulfur binding region domain-containing protein, partial [Vampirovibrionia bacterium]
RIGGFQMLNILQDISKGNGVKEDLRKLKLISHAMQKASLCGLGQTAPNPVLSALKYFEDEFNSHVVDKKCPAGKCSELLGYSIDPEHCVKCGLCVKNCPVEAITGSKQTGYVINKNTCIKCGRCADVCKFDAVTVS